MKPEKKAPADGQSRPEMGRDTGFIGCSKPEQCNRNLREYGNPSEPRQKETRLAYGNFPKDMEVPVCGAVLS